MLLLLQFLYRLGFGMAAAMVVTSPRLVSSGYYRNNAYVLLGLNSLAAVVAMSVGESRAAAPAWIPIAAAVGSYATAVCWLYERPRGGILALLGIAALDLAGLLIAVPTAGRSPGVAMLFQADAVASGWLLGVTMAAMLLGHWYLNAPGMQLAPLQKLNGLIGSAVVLRTVVSGLGLVALWQMHADWEFARALMIALRWLAGIAGTALLVWMTRATLQIPNTQAATGLLYVAVITTFLGELVGQLLSASGAYPL